MEKKDNKTIVKPKLVKKHLLRLWPFAKKENLFTTLKQCAFQGYPGVP